MRTLVVLGLMMVGLVIGALYSQQYLADSGQKLSAQIEDVQIAINEGNWQEADKLTEELIRSWHKTSIGWGLLTEHQEIDDINNTLARLSGFVKDKEAPSSLAEGKAALHLFRHIPEKESLTLANLL